MIHGSDLKLRTAPHLVQISNSSLNSAISHCPHCQQPSPRRQGLTTLLGLPALPWPMQPVWHPSLCQSIPSQLWTSQWNRVTWCQRPVSSRISLPHPLGPMVLRLLSAHPSTVSLYLEHSPKRTPSPVSFSLRCSQKPGAPALPLLPTHSCVSLLL